MHVGMASVDAQLVELLQIYDHLSCSLLFADLTSLTINYEECLYVHLCLHQRFIAT